MFINVVITSSSWEGEEEERRRVYGMVQCHKSGEAPKRNHVPKGTPGSRNGSSSRNNCPFKWTINRKKLKGENGDHYYCYFIKALNNNHNHPANEALFKSLSTQRQLTEDQLVYMKEMMEIGASPSDMVTGLSKRYPGQIFINRTIYQARLKIRKNILNNRTPIQHLVDELSASGSYQFNMDTDNEGKVTRLFFSHASSIDLFNRYHTVLVMDSTYKTNKFGMPLLEIGGMTNSNSTFLLGCIFLSSEEQSSYEWALRQLSRFCFMRNTPKVIVTDRENALINAITIILPSSTHFLCRWHISKNVLTHINKIFKSLSKEDSDNLLKYWQTVMQESFTPEEYERNLTTLKDALPLSGKAAFEQYLYNEWIPHKEK